MISCDNNTNKLLKEISGVTGIKTSTTYATDKCFICIYPITIEHILQLLLILAKMKDGKIQENYLIILINITKRERAEISALLHIIF